MKEEDYMRMAFAEAAKFRGLTSPNPQVGAVLVKDGKVIGKGGHSGAGRPHAEVEALKQARDKYSEEEIRGADAYVTLEPCSTHGRTGACTKRILEGGVSRVFWSVDDPNPEHVGRAEEVLREAGVEVKKGILLKEGERLIRPFKRVVTAGLPWVTVKQALSLDGGLSRPPGEKQWLSNEKSLQEVQELRSEVDGILIGGGTARVDNPRLTLRGEFANKRSQPWRVVLTERECAGLDEKAHLRADEFVAKTLFLSGQDLRATLKKLVKEYKINHLLVEAGGGLVSSLLEEGLVNEMVLFLCPLITGGADMSVQGLEVEKNLKELEYKRIGDIICMRGIL